VFRIFLILLFIPITVSAVQQNVLLITIDTFRADHLGFSGKTAIKTPNLDQLAKQSLFFENAISPAPLTLPSHTSIMTGRNPSSHGTRDNAGRVREQELTLAEILKSNGYHTYAVVGGFPLEHRFGLNQGFDIYDDQFPRQSGRPLDFGSERNARSVADSFLRIQKKEPYFIWLHFYDPHAPYLNGGYEGEIEYIDAEIARVIARVNSNNTFIIVAGDHGEGLGEHKEWTHRIFLYDSTMHVPFFISGPGIQPAKIKTQARLIDFLPTILNKLQIKIPNLVDGSPLPHPFEKAAVLESMFPKLQLGWSSLQAVRTNEWKLIESPKPELYDLRSDPKETVNVIQKHPDVVKQLRKQLPTKDEVTNSEISPEMAEQLASLGYVGGNTNNAANLPDPKNRIEVWNLIEQAHDLEIKDANKSIELLETARKSDPENPMVLNILAELYSDQNSFPEAKQILKKILNSDPKNVPALLRMARLSLKTGVPKDAIKYATILQSLGEGHADTHLLMASAYIKTNNLNLAAEHMRKALQIDPADNATRIDLGNLYLQMDQAPKGRIEFQEALKVDPKSVQALNGLATIQFKAGNFTESEKHLQKALSISPKDPQTRLNLALVFSAQDKKAEAIAIYKEVAESDSISVDWRNIARNRLKELEQ
jgi:tetratricopeptide (TPR) repeat protein